MTRPALLFAAAACLAAPAALAGGPGCGCAAPVVPGATVDLEFAGCPGCATVGPACGPTCGAPAAYGYGYPAYGQPCCDNRNYAQRPGCGTGNGFTGGLRRLWDLEKRKNAWLKKTFIDGPRGKLCCGLRDDCAPVCAPACGDVCAPACGDVCAPACAAPAYAAPACDLGCGDAAYGPVCEPGCAAPVVVPGCAAPAFAAPTCGCN